MIDFLDAQLGRIFLVLAIAWSVAAALLNPPVGVSFPEQAQVPQAGEVMVKLDPKKLATASPEIHFPDRTPQEYRGREHPIFVPEKRKFEFQPVDLTVPQANVPRAPQVLPSPGPALEGTEKLPRWGEELPPLTPPAPPPGTQPKKVP